MKNSVDCVLAYYMSQLNLRDLCKTIFWRPVFSIVTFLRSPKLTKFLPLNQEIGIKDTTPKVVALSQINCVDKFLPNFKV